MMKVMSEYPRELKAWQARVKNERRRVLRRLSEAIERGDQFILVEEMPAMPHKGTVTMNYDEWRSML
jgi:hypothetical protein